MQGSSLSFPKVLASCIPVLAALACGPTDPATTRLSLVPTADQSIGFADAAAFSYQTASLTVTAEGADGAVVYSAANAPRGSLLDPSTGNFSWTPTIADFGSNTIVFTATAPNGSASDTVIFTVAAPVMPSGEAFRFVTPSGGETFNYGDTILLTWLQDYTLTRNAILDVSSNNGVTYCRYFPSQAEWPVYGRDRDATTDRYFRDIDSHSAVGVYRMVLVDKVTNFGCTVSFAESGMIFRVSNEYATELVAIRGDQTDAGFAVVR